MSSYLTDSSACVGIIWVMEGVIRLAGKGGG